MSADHLVLITGDSGAGKSASLMGIRNQEKWAYLCCEAGKKLPFKSGFKEVIVTNPYQVPEMISGVTGKDTCEGIIIDSLSFLMGMFETQCVLTSADTQKAWGEYSQFAIKMMQQDVAKCDKTVIFTSHVADSMDEVTGDRKSQAVVKGALRNLSMESFFSCVVSAKKIKVTQLEKELTDAGCEPDADGNWNDCLRITAKERRINLKYVFQTDVTAKTLHERTRSPMGMWDDRELYIDNNVQYLHDRLTAFYA